jgi:hypothetical protein
MCHYVENDMAALRGVADFKAFCDSPPNSNIHDETTNTNDGEYPYTRRHLQVDEG